MNRCDRKVEIGRRRFLSGAGVAAAAGAAATVVPQRAEASPQLARVSYPSNRLANVSDLKPNAALQVAYPDADAPGVLLKLGAKVEGGVGPDGDIVGFSDDVPAQGVPPGVQCRRQDAELPRPLLAVRLRARRPPDLGHATQNLPQYTLRMDDKGDMYDKGSTNSSTVACRTC